ncbi:MAG TPA: peptidase [Dehalococcoidia bacterium]|nr:peptidase [Dehalococcoidia bacterium]
MRSRVGRVANRMAIVGFSALCLLVSCGSASVTAARKGTATHNPAAVSHALPAAAGSISCQAAASANAYLTCRYDGPNAASMGFLLFVPQHPAPATATATGQTYPLVLVLHGGEEMANPKFSAAQNAAILKGQEYINVWGPGSPAGSGPSIQSRWPCYVVVPQTLMPSRWVGLPASVGSYAMSPQPSASLTMAMQIMELIQRRYTDIDPGRRYITGISMGAYGVWDAIERWPTYFAAAVPASGAGDPALAGELVALPIWAFHGSVDKVVPVSGSRDMIRAITAAGGQPRYTEYAGADHGIWHAVYGISDNPSNPLYPWLFAQRRGANGRSASDADGSAPAHTFR